MALRYGAAVAAAYLAFLLLLWIWVTSRRGNPAGELVDLAELATPEGSEPADPAGASALPAEAPASGSSSSGFGLDLPDDEIAVALAVLVAIAATGSGRPSCVLASPPSGSLSR